MAKGNGKDALKKARQEAARQRNQVKELEQRVANKDAIIQQLRDKLREEDPECLRQQLEQAHRESNRFKTEAVELQGKFQAAREEWLRTGRETEAKHKAKVADLEHELRGAQNNASLAKELLDTFRAQMEAKLDEADVVKLRRRLQERGDKIKEQARQIKQLEAQVRELSKPAFKLPRRSRG